MWIFCLKRVPQRYVEKYKLLDISTAYKWIHFPENEKHLHAPFVH